MLIFCSRAGWRQQ